MVIDETIALYIVGAVVLILIVWIIRLERKLRKLLGGSSAKNIEDSISHIRKEVESLDEFRKQSEEYLKIVENRLRQSIQGVETVRFNPFRGTGDGGNQSFSTVFLNEKGDGVVLSSLYSRERVSIFSKPLSNFQSEYELSGEEKEVLKRAKDTVSKR